MGEFVAAHLLGCVMVLELLHPSARPQSSPGYLTAVQWSALAWYCFVALEVDLMACVFFDCSDNFGAYFLIHSPLVFSEPFLPSSRLEAMLWQISCILFVALSYRFICCCSPRDSQCGGLQGRMMERTLSGITPWYESLSSAFDLNVNSSR